MCDRIASAHDHGRGPRRRRAGLSAAHELAERGFEVTVYEQRDAPAARRAACPVPGSGTGGRADLPGEHGFRFFPGFYRHLPDTMAAHPGPGGGSVADHLVGAEQMLIAQAGGRDELIAPPPTRPSRLDDLELLRASCAAFAGQLGIPAHEYAALRRAAADAAHELRRAPLRAVGAAELVGVRRRRPPQRGVPEVPRRRAHAHARGRAGARDERPHRRADPAAAAVRPLARRRPRRPRARRADQRGVDRPVGRAPARRSGVDAAARRAGRGDPHARAVAGVAVRRPRAARRCRPTTTSPRCRSRSCASSPRPRCAPPSRG